MNSPLAALTWEIWQRGRRLAWLILACLSVCAILNVTFLGRPQTSDAARDVFPAVFGLLNVASFVLLMGIFNYTEFNSSREWNGFPYRLFVLPVRTWQLVALPMFAAVMAVELVFFAWLKLVWTHGEILKPVWFAALLGACVACYQMTIWSLAGLRIMRILALGVGAVSCIAIVYLPFSGDAEFSPWLHERRLIPFVLATAIIAFLVAWASVARQRSGGGRRQNRIRLIANRLVDALPRRVRDFKSPSAAQFWFEWRRTGWLLPACTAFVLIAAIAPVSWVFRADRDFTETALLKILAMPVVLSFVIGKSFIKPEFWSMNLALPAFPAVRPLSSGDFVLSKMKVAAVSVVLAWLLVLAFIAIWLFGWANTAQLQFWLWVIQHLCPHAWPVILVLLLAVFPMLCWRFLVNGMWGGLSGNRFRYFGLTALQIIIPAAIAIICAIWSNPIDQAIKDHPEIMKSAALSMIGWILAVAVILKVWLAVASWSKILSRPMSKYLVVWPAVTVVFVALGILAGRPLDTYRLEHLYVLGALLLVPLARLGFAPASLSGNRHR